MITLQETVVAHTPIELGQTEEPVPTLSGVKTKTKTKTVFCVGKYLSDCYDEKDRQIFVKSQHWPTVKAVYDRIVGNNLSAPIKAFWRG